MAQASASMLDNKITLNFVRGGMVYLLALMVRLLALTGTGTLGDQGEFLWVKPWVSSSE